LIFNVNTDSVVALTNKLEKLNRSAFPVAVRGTLNDAAFDVKTRSMPESSRSTFEQRRPNFFKANSKFIPAQGFNLNTMQSDVGFYENKLQNRSTNFAVKDLEQQESGGSINGKTFIPTIYAREGRTSKGNVRPNFRLKAIRKKGILKASEATGKFHNFSKRQQFVAAANRSKGGFVLYKDTLFKITSAFGKKIDADPLYTVKKGRRVSVDQTNFMSEASLVTSNKMDGFYVNQALRQFKKAGLIR
jgi:hypothetical protein